LVERQAAMRRLNAGGLGVTAARAVVSAAVLTKLTAGPAVGLLFLLAALQVVARKRPLRIGAPGRKIRSRIGRAGVVVAGNPGRVLGSIHDLDCRTGIHPEGKPYRHLLEDGE